MRPASSEQRKVASTAIHDELEHFLKERQWQVKPAHAADLFLGEPITRTWSRLLGFIGIGTGDASHFPHPRPRTRLALLSESKEAGTAVQDEPEQLVTERQSRARTVHGDSLSGEPIARKWLRLLGSIGFGGEKVAHFPHLAPRMRLGLSKRSKRAGIVASIVLAVFMTLGLGAVILAAFNSFKIEMTGLKRDLAAAREKLAKLEANVSAALLSEKMKRGFDDRMLGSTSVTPTIQFALSREEIQLIRDFIKVPPPLPGAAQNINIGDHLPETTLAPLPEPIMEKVPKLRGARYTVDRNSAIVVVAPGTDRADVIINPS
jgi:hypothetical protein